MFDTVRFGRELSTLRRQADMTQSEVADRLNLSHQAVSKYERGESFPDISVLVMIAELFGVSFDRLIGFGNPTKGEAAILGGVARGDTDRAVGDISDVVELAPFLKPSILGRLSRQFEGQGVDISHVLSLAEYLNDDAVVRLIESADHDSIDDGILERFVPVLSREAKETLFQRILDGELDWRFIKALLPHADYIESQIEAAVVAGVLPWEALDILKDRIWGDRR